MVSIQRALEHAVQKLAASSDSAVLDAEVLLSRILQKPRSYLRTWPDRFLDAQQANSFWTAIDQRQQGQPVAYLTGYREFWSRDFLVTPDVLIPRPDTELLVECALKLMPVDRASRIIDLGTGSGIIAVTLAAERPRADVVATDISQPALAVAQANAGRHGVGRIQLYLSDWFGQVPDGLFDLVASNPPYIAEGDPHLQDGDLRFEPQTALSAPDAGLAYIRTLADQARNRLHTGGSLLIEHGYNQHTAVRNIFNDFCYSNVQTHIDLGGQPRVTVGQWFP